MLLLTEWPANLSYNRILIVDRLLESAGDRAFSRTCFDGGADGPVACLELREELARPVIFRRS